MPLPQPRMRKEPRFSEVVWTRCMLSWPARQSLNMWIGRAADYLEPELGKAKAKIGDLAKDDFGLLIYALYPTTGEQFLKWKYGLEEKPASVKPKTLDDIRKEDEAMAAALERLCKNI